MGGLDARWEGTGNTGNKCILNKTKKKCFEMSIVTNTFLLGKIEFVLSVFISIRLRNENRK